jgi:hypothetical protein
VPWDTSSEASSSNSAKSSSGEEEAIYIGKPPIESNTSFFLKNFK